MAATFRGDPVTIPSDRAKLVRSRIVVPKLGEDVRRLRVVADVEHSDPTDLVVDLRMPDGAILNLHDRARELQRPITVEFSPREVVGEWVLELRDVRPKDGGRVSGWRIEVVETGLPFQPEVVFVGDWSQGQQDVVVEAVMAVARVITRSLGTVTLGDGTVVRDHRVTMTAEPIDGPGGVLGVSGPTAMRWGSRLPAASAQTLDTADKDGAYEAESLGQIVGHEFGHGLGLCNLGPLHDLVLVADPPLWTGSQALAAYRSLGGTRTDGVPLEDGGGPGTRLAHWEEDVFRNERMTGYIQRGDNPFSVLSVAALGDLGYEVDLGRADPYSLPALGTPSLREHHARACRHLPIPEPEWVGSH